MSLRLEEEWKEQDHALRDGERKTPRSALLHCSVERVAGLEAAVEVGVPATAVPLAPTRHKTRSQGEGAEAGDGEGDAEEDLHEER